MKIAMVTETYPPEVNGVARTVQEMVEGLRRRGHDIRLARPRQGGRVELGADARLNGIRVAALDSARAAQRGPGLVAFILADPMDARWFHPGEIVRLTRDER